MKYCPVCRSEFEDYVEECPDDHVALVAELPEIHHEKDLDLILLKKFTSKTEADMVRNVLEDAKIHTITKNDFFSSAFSVGSGNALGTQIKIFVPKKELENAKTALEGMIDLE